MSGDAEKKEATETPSAGQAPNDGLVELRRMLVRAEEVSDVLPKAIRRGSGRDRRLAEATLPVVEENIRLSAQRNPRVLADAIFPIIGPAIRKAIAEALGQMVQSLNQTLEHSLSPKGIRWRLEAMRTGKPFAEVVLLHTLLYRVEQVFLVYTESGLLLQHVTAVPGASQDGDLVSAMLTAIQDFVQDSFTAAENAELNELKIRDLSVWIEHGPDIIVAAVIRGNAPLSLRETLVETVEQIEFDFEAELAAFSGDTGPFDRARPLLERCLSFQLGEQQGSAGRFLTPARALAGFVLVIALLAGFLVVRDQYRWSGFVSRLRSEPGIAVTETGRGLLTHSVSGLRDEFAADPAAIAAEYGYDAGDVVHDWRRFEDIHPAFIQRRAERLLRPPAGVALRFENGTILADGNVPDPWLASAATIAPALAGVTGLQLSPSALKDRIESARIPFVCGSDEFESGDAAVERLVAAIERMLESRPEARFEIGGFADATGTPEFNERISRLRAERLLGELRRRSAVIEQRSGSFTVRAAGSGDSAVGCEARARLLSDIN